MGHTYLMYVMLAKFYAAYEPRPGGIQRLTSTTQSFLVPFEMQLQPDVVWEGNLLNQLLLPDTAHDGVIPHPPTYDPSHLQRMVGFDKDRTPSFVICHLS